MKKSFFCFILLVIFSLVGYCSVKFHFNVKSEGIYKIKTPNIFKKNEIYVSFYQRGYKVKPIGDYIYIYCPFQGEYTLSLTNELITKHINISEYNIIEEKKYYKYSLPNSLNKNHWFLDIISENKRFKKTVYRGISKKHKKEYLTFKLYNFKNSNAPLILRINGQDKHFILKGNGDHTITTSVGVNSKSLNLEVISPFYEIGIKKIIIKSYRDKVVLVEDFFEKYSFSNLSQLKEIKQDYFYFTLSKDRFERVSKKSKITNLILQKKNTIKEITKLNKIIYPNNSKSDFLIVYNSTIIDDLNISSLNSLLKKINPNLQYRFVNVQHIYDKYSSSNPSPISIKKYLHKISPKYVLLLGNASEKEDFNDLIPTFYYIQDEKFTRIETDYTYTYLSNPANPQFSIGRLPFKSSSELNSFIKKTNSFLINKTNKGYSIYDDISVINNIKVNYTSYKKQSSLKKFFGSETITPYINSQNPTTFQFIGHASYTGWSKNKKVDISNMNSINDGNTFILIDLGIPRFFLIH